MHMIGQVEEVFMTEPKTSEIASWMNLSKPTARKYLNSMVKSGKLIKTTQEYRANSSVDKWSLAHEYKVAYREGKFAPQYKFFAQRVMKVILP